MLSLNDSLTPFSCLPDFVRDMSLRSISSAVAGRAASMPPRRAMSVRKEAISRVRATYILSREDEGD